MGEDPLHAPAFVVELPASMVQTGECVRDGKTLPEEYGIVKDNLLETWIRDRCLLGQFPAEQTMFPILSEIMQTSFDTALQATDTIELCQLRAFDRVSDDGAIESHEVQTICTQSTPEDIRFIF